MSTIVGFAIVLIGGGFAGALITRYFVLRDRKIKKLTLTVTKEEVQSMVAVTINDKQFSNLTYKEFTLFNGTNQDLESVDLFFEFDKESEVVFDETQSKLGVNRCDKNAFKASEYIYHIKNFNRKDSITFKFQVANISRNFFSAVVDKTGVELEILQARAIEKPSLPPGKFVSKTKLA